MKDLNYGHRKRLKEQFLKLPIRSLPDYEILEMLLFSVFPRKDTKIIAKNLLAKFGSFDEILNAESADLKKIPDVGDATVFQMKLLLDLFSRLHLANDNKAQVLGNWRSVIKYCNLSMGFRKTEALRTLYLNKKNILISDDLSEGGTIDKVQVYPREIAKKAIEYSASSIVLVHNHPTGDPSPSSQDIAVTKEIAKALAPLSIEIHDHLIIAKNDHFSFRANGLL